MCTIPPPPPQPPPPPLHIDLHTSTKSPTSDNGSTFYSSDECEWASDNPQLREACVKYNLCTHTPPYRYKYNHFDTILQVGPTCGMAALSMLVKAKATATEILEIAKSERFSNNGEMFSCNNMAKLAENVLNLMKMQHMKTDVETGLFRKEVIDDLLEGAVLLVPYDADCNHSPCLKNGHTAHWALICGVIVVKDPGESYDSGSKNVYVLSRHGKSKHLVAWDLEVLSNSNKNLWEFSPKRGDDGLVYILPEDGIGGKNGLRDQFVIFRQI